MEDKNKYFVAKRKTVSEALLRVAEAKKFLETERVTTAQEAADKVGINRSPFYEYKDDIFPFHGNTKGKTIILVVQMDDEQGLLDDLLYVVTVYRTSILTVHQSIPASGVATLTLSMEVGDNTDNMFSMIDELEVLDEIHYVKILAREQRCLKGKDEV